jgi:hypothetical protein
MSIGVMSDPDLENAECDCEEQAERQTSYHWRGEIGT